MSRMRVRFVAAILAACLLASCGGKKPKPTAFPSSTPRPTMGVATPTVMPDEVSYKVAAFYYPWYEVPAYDHQWGHWTQNGHVPPQDIASDFYPALGPYSSNDATVVAQHMAWLRRAGVGVIIVSWWGRGSVEERPVPLILQTAAQYGIKVAFQIEPYDSRTAESLVGDVQYIYERYGDSPAFFRTSTTSSYSTGSQPKGLFFLWCVVSPSTCGDETVEAGYWQKALDAVHALPQGALVIANTTDPSAINRGHFDGLYNYATLDLQQAGGFAWAHTLPPGALYVPSVIPGMSATRVGYPASTYVARRDGETYKEQWSAALNTGVQPFMVTITSFNEWHEGTMIEPAATGRVDGRGYSYADYDALPPDGYLALTHQWIGRLEKVAPPAPIRARIAIKTRSDWTTVNVVSGGFWMRPLLRSASDTATNIGFESGDHFILAQSRDSAGHDQFVEMVWDIEIAGLAPGGKLSLQIDRGSIGSTEVTIYNYLDTSPVPVAIFTSGQVTGDRNSEMLSISADKLLLPPDP